MTLLDAKAILIEFERIGCEINDGLNLLLAEGLISDNVILFGDICNVDGVKCVQFLKTYNAPNELLPPATCSALEAEVRNILGYPEGDILSMVRRYHAYATNEISTLRRGGERVATYCQKLQEQLPKEAVMKLGLAAVQTAVQSEASRSA